MSSARLPVFEKFIGDLRAIWAADTANQRRMERAKPLLDEIWRLGDLTRSEVFEGIRKPELHAFMDMLERMDDNLKKLEGKGPATLRNVGQAS